MSKAAAVILNYNGRHYLQKFLPSVIKHSPSYLEIIVADNASTDDSIDWLKQNYPQVRLIHNEKNFGFAGGYNEALRQVDAEIFILLNSDLAVTEGYAEPVIKALEDDPLLAAAQPKILWHTQPEKFEYAGAAGGFIDKYGFTFCRGRIFNTLESDHGQYNKTTEVFWASGACFFIKAEEFRKMDGFDADFFAHMEEIDLCWRLKNSGKKIACVPDSIVYHLGGGTLGTESPHKTYLNYRNNLFMMVKNLRARVFGTMFVRLSLDGLSAVRLLLQGKIGHVFAILKAHIHFYTSLSSLLQKRKKSLHYTIGGNLSGWYKGSIVVDYFLKSKQRYSQLEPSEFNFPKANSGSLD